MDSHRHAPQNRTKKGKGICVYCGREKKITSDHVFPQSLFIVLDKEMITVPACHQCQRDKDLGDRDLEIYVNLDVMGSMHPDSIEHAKKIVNRNESTRRWLTKVFEEAEKVDFTTDEGIWLAEGFSFPFNHERIEKSIRMMARALYFHTTGTILPQECKDVAIQIPWNIGGEFARRIGSYRKKDPEIKGNLVVWWLPLPIEAVGEHDAAYFVCFNDAVLYMLATDHWAVHVASIYERLNESNEEEKPGKLEYILPKNVDGTYIIPN